MSTFPYDTALDRAMQGDEITVPAANSLEGWPYNEIVALRKAVRKSDAYFVKETNELRKLLGWHQGEDAFLRSQIAKLREQLNSLQQSYAQACLKLDHNNEQPL